MLQYQEIINKIGNPSIETISNNDVKIFHLTQSKGGITITDSGNAYTDEEFEKAQNGLIDFSDNFHAHDSFFLIYVLKGCNLEIVEGEPIMVTSNDLLMLTPYTQHHNVRTASSQVLFIHIDPVTLFNILQPAMLQNILFSDFFSDFLTDRYVRKSIFFENCMDSIRFFIDKIITEYVDEPFLFENNMQYHLGSLIIQLARSYSYKTLHFSDEMTDKVNSILKYITSNYKDVTLEAAAKHFGYHPAYLSRLIHQYSGRTFSQLLTDYKLMKAAILIKAKQLSIEEIAYECGYNELSTFYKAFSKKYHCAPRSLL